MLRIPPILKPLLYPPGFLYEALIRARNALYQTGRLRQRQLSRPVISVGNITLGGTGKTPLVIYLARILLRRGYETALLTRGYGRSAAGRDHLVPSGAEVVPSASVLGDEPALIRRHVPGIWLGVSANRHHMGSRILAKTRAPVFLLDDAFQHRKLKRDLDLVVIDGRRKLEDDRVFPLGTLREPLCGLRRADAIIINRGSEDEGFPRAEDAIRRFMPAGAIFNCRQKIHHLVPFESWRRTDSPEPRRDTIRSAFLVAAIGNPLRFRRDVEARNIAVKGARFYRDHFPMKRKDWIACAEEAKACGAEVLVTTEKDAVKLGRSPDFPTFVATQSIELVEEEDFLQLVQKAIEGN